MDVIANILKDVTPGVGLLIVVLYLGRLGINAFSSQQKSANTHMEKLIEMAGDFNLTAKEFSATVREMDRNRHEDMLKITLGNNETFRELKNTIDQQSELLSSLFGDK